MCGIAAAYTYDPQAQPLAPTWLEAVCARMAARGPDGQGLWHSGPVSLGHRRLSIIDLGQGGSQPMALAESGLHVVFNGEIYNYQALRAELEGQGCVFTSHSDTEVLLHLYRRDGTAMLERLRGMFAFALWDEARQGLFLARDPFGIKPLYYADDGHHIRVASQVKALLAGGGVDTAACDAGHVGFFLWGHVPEPFTLYRGISALPAGEWMWIGRNGERRRGKHFDLRQEIVAAQRNPHAVELGQALRDSVRHHLVADVPVGVFLSAGIDSASLASFAVQAAGTGLETLTLGFDRLKGDPRDETPLAGELARQLGTRHQTQWIDAADFLENREQILADMDQPSVDGVNTWFVARAARRAGWKVALSGLGGDELLGGYDNFRTLPKLERLLRPAGLAPGLGRAVRLATSGWIGCFTSPKAAGLLELGPVLSDAYLLKRGLHMPWERPSVVDRDVWSNGLAQLDQRNALRQSIDGIGGNLRVTALETAFYMRNQLLRDADWAGMAHSLEIRTPLVDVDLFRACLPALALAQAPTKNDMGRIAGLPQAYLQRPKTGFNVPVAQWMGMSGPSSRDWAAHVYGSFLRS